MWAASATDIYAVGYGGTVLRSRGDGTWQAQMIGTTSDLYAVWGTGPDDVFVAGVGPGIFHSTGDGTWVETDAAMPVQAISGVWGSAPGDVYLAGNEGVILHGP